RPGEDSSRKLTWISGWALAMAFSKGGSRVAPEVGMQPSITEPRFKPESSSNSWRPLSNCLSASAALVLNSSPGGVRRAPWRDRSKSAPPNSSSNLATWEDREGWDTRQALAAAVNDPVRTMARKYFNWWISMGYP